MAMSCKERKAKQRSTERGYALSREVQWRQQGIINASYQSYLEMIVAQKSLCAIVDCNHAIDSSSPLDHDHKTGLVRSVLCAPCNLLLGRVEAESVARLHNMARYLEQYA